MEENFQAAVLLFTSFFLILVVFNSLLLFWYRLLKTTYIYLVLIMHQALCKRAKGE